MRKGAIIKIFGLIGLLGSIAGQLYETAKEQEVEDRLDEMEARLNEIGIVETDEEA